MDINIKLSKNFTTQWNKLQAEYGTDIARINGFDDGQLSYTDFIDNFIDETVVADASIDGNSNVSHKDIVTLMSEMPKPHRKMLAFNKIYYEMQKKYGFSTANEWLEMEWSGKLYLHDSDTSSLTSYCFAYSLKDLAEKGLFFIGGLFNPRPASHLTTFVDFVKEFISYASNRTSGAVGLPDLIPYMYYFWKKDVDADYMGIRTSGCSERYAKQNCQRFIYAVNQPYVRDGTQTAFTNTSVFDRPYFEALFGGSEFPDGTFMIDYEEDIIKFQVWYMEVMAEIRHENMFTFPVSTISLLRSDGEFKDKEFSDWAIRHNMEWSDSNIFVSDTVTSLSNCCFSGEQMTLSKSSKGVNYMSFKELYESGYKETKRNFTIFHNGRWERGKLIRLPARSLYRVKTANNKEIIVTNNHINPTLRGNIATTDLTTSDYLMFNTRALHSFTEADKHLTYLHGMLVGMYAGDGSMRDANETAVVLSLNEEKYNKSFDLISKVCTSIDANARVYLGKINGSLYTVNISSKIVTAFIREYISGKYCHEKSLNMDCLLQSLEFRQGILQGYYLTDGGNSNRIYTTSKIMASNLEAMITSLGLQSIIDISDRTGKGVVKIGNKIFNRNYPLYCVRWYEECNKKCRKDVYIKQNNSIYFKITSITPYEGTSDPVGNVYCFEMSNSQEPYFTLPNGIITHNCRLKSDISSLGYFNSIGGTALKVGSVKVSTINLARLALDTDTEERYLTELRHRTIVTCRVLDIVRHIIKRNVDKGLLPNFTHGLVSFKYLYNTIGFIGIYETMKKFGYTEVDELGNVSYTDKAAEFGRKIFEAMRQTADQFLDTGVCGEKPDYQINTEQIPGESAASKLMKKDKFFYPDADIYDLPLYGNQFMPLGIQSTLQERIRVQALFDGYCNGGSILHANIDAPFDSFEKAKKMVEYIADAGVTYFAFNTKIQACENNHAFYGTTCPVCGKPIHTEFTRIVGFYTPIKTWSRPRTREYGMRKWEKINVTAESIQEAA